MPAAKLGRGTFINLGEESTWGNAVSPTVSNRIASESLKRTQERSQKTHLSTSLGVFAFSPAFDGFEICEGDIEHPIGYNGSGLLLKAACGALATTGPVGPDYTHTYSAGTTGDLPSLTCHLQRGNSTSERFYGLIVSSMSLSIEAGGQMMGSFSFVGKSAETRTAAITSSFNASNLDVFHYEASSLSYNGNTYDLRSMNLNLENQVERRNLLGSKLTAQPSITDLRTITLECTADHEGDVLYNSQIDGDISDVVISFTNGSLSLTITLKSCQITAYSDDINSGGRIENSVTFQGFADAGGANDAFTIAIVNTQASGIAN